MTIEETQPVKLLLKGLPVMESFYTIQGEGFHQGRAAFFIRLAGCDVGCHWCDVKESWDANKHPVLPLNEIVAKASAFSSNIVVVTGGEPLMHDLTVLCEELHEKGFKTHIETSGSSPLTGKWDWICLSPKKFKPAMPEVFELANELKVVIFNKSDLIWCGELAKQVNPDCHLFIQPEWSQSEKVIPLMVEFVKENPKWRIGLQVHKFLRIP